MIKILKIMNKVLRRLAFLVVSILLLVPAMFLYVLGNSVEWIATGRTVRMDAYVEKVAAFIERWI